MLYNRRHVVESKCFLGFSSRLDFSVKFNSKVGIAPDYFHNPFEWAGQITSESYAFYEK